MARKKAVGRPPRTDDARRTARVGDRTLSATEIIFNPSRWDRRLAAFRERVIGWLQRRREARRIAFA